ncbi:MAG TPA: family 16 glycoside hydrolase, partial [Opitutaceae bacterium]|nr:family 16 glycoside hydrolase [Opitutaceae bacterium]
MHAPTLPASPNREVARIACLLWVATLAATAIATTSADDAHNVPPEGFRALFNGQDLAGWWGATTEDPRGWMAMPPGEFQAKRAASLADIRAHWRVENGELVNDGDGLYLTTDAHFRDYELLIDYKTVAGADSGIYLKGCPQVQIWDSTEAGGKWDVGADKGSGGLWNNSPGRPGKDPLVLADWPLGEWNQFRIVQCGSRTWVWLNGQKVVEGAILENYFDETRSLPIPVAAPIQLQTHGGEIRWRNIFVRDLAPAEANLWLSEIAKDGFEPVFNGRDLSGWAGAIDSYEVVGDAIAGRADKGGTIHTEREFGNLVARLEFKLPPGGNNGLAIRYP